MFTIAAISLIKTKKASVVVWIFLFVSLISLGEEISWGQRILNIQTPTFIADANNQSELNFHNLHIFSGGNTWRHFFKTGEFDYYQLLDTQNAFRIGFVVFFIIFPILRALNIGTKIFNNIGYERPERYFTLFIILFLILSFILPIGETFDYAHVVQEMREMSYAFYIALYLLGLPYLLKAKA